MNGICRFKQTNHYLELRVTETVFENHIFSATKQIKTFSSHPVSSPTRNSTKFFYFKENNKLAKALNFSDRNLTKRIKTTKAFNFKGHFHNSLNKFRPSINISETSICINGTTVLTHRNYASTLRNFICSSTF